MRALLLAAGVGSRLRPITDLVPKCLVPIHGIPLLQYWLALLEASEVKDVLVNLHYKHEMVEEFLAKANYPGNLQTTYEEDLLGTAGTLNKNRSFFGNSTTLLVHADNLTIFDLKKFENAHMHRPANCAITMLTFDTLSPETCGIVETDGFGVVQKFHEKVKSPPSKHANGAVYLLENEVFDFMHTLGKEVIDFSTEVIPNYMGRIFTHHNTIYHRDIGNLASLQAAQRDFPKQKINHSHLPRHLEASYKKIAEIING